MNSQIRGEYIPVKRLAKILRITIDPKDMGRNPVPVYSIPAYDSGELVEIVHPSEIGSSKTWVPQDSALVSLLNPRIPRTVKARGQSYSSPEFAVIEPGQQVDLNYLTYALSSSDFWSYLQALAFGATGSRSRASRDNVSNFEVWVPSLEIQRRIVAFLDDETTQIDKTIIRIDKVIELLQERHQAFIDSCVQGSGKYAPLSLVIKQSQTGPFGTQLSAEEYVSGGIPIINPTHLQDGEIIPEKDISVSPNTFERLKRFALSEGDLILGRKGDVRKSALIKTSNLPALCGSDSLFLRPTLDQINPSFLRWWFRSTEAFEHLSTHSVGATLAGLNQEIIQLTRVPLPTLAEQANIVQCLEDDTRSNALMKEKALVMRNLLSERRLALITAAVTGGIKV